MIFLPNKFPYHIPFQLKFDYNDLVEKLIIDEKYIQRFQENENISYLLKEINHSYVEWLFRPNTILIADTISNTKQKLTYLTTLSEKNYYLFTTISQLLKVLNQKYFSSDKYEKNKDQYAITLYQYYSKKYKEQLPGFAIIFYDLGKNRLSIFENPTQQTLNQIEQYF